MKYHIIINSKRQFLNFVQHYFSHIAGQIIEMFYYIKTIYLYSIEIEIAILIKLLLNLIEILSCQKRQR